MSEQYDESYDEGDGQGYEGETYTQDEAIEYLIQREHERELAEQQSASEQQGPDALPEDPEQWTDAQVQAALESLPGEERLALLREARDDPERGLDLKNEEARRNFMAAVAEADAEIKGGRARRPPGTASWAGSRWPLS